MSEQAIAKIVVDWLTSESWDVYQEVERGGCVADIVAVMGPICSVIEVKTTLSLSVIAQADEWRRRGAAHYSWIAVPMARHSRARDFANRLCHDRGIGILGVSQIKHDYDWVSPVNVEVRAALLRRVNVKHWDLQPEHKTAAAAGAIGGGGRWTPFRATCSRLSGIVERSPGINLSAAIKQLDHHYSSYHSARSTLKSWIEAGNLEGVRLEGEGNTATLFPASAG